MCVGKRTDPSRNNKFLKSNFFSLTLKHPYFVFLYQKNGLPEALIPGLHVIREDSKVVLSIPLDAHSDVSRFKARHVELCKSFVSTYKKNPICANLLVPSLFGRVICPMSVVSV